MPRFNLIDYFSNGGSKSMFNYNFEDYDEHHDLEKIGIFLDSIIKDCIKYNLFDPKKSNSMYTISTGSNGIDIYTIFITGYECFTNKIAISFHNGTVIFYDYFLFDDDLYFNSWESFLQLYCKDTIS